MVIQYHMPRIFEYQTLLIENYDLCSSVHMCVGTCYTEIARGRELKVGTAFVMQSHFHFFKATKSIFCDNRCSISIVTRSADRLNWVNARGHHESRAFVVYVTNDEIKMPVYPTLID